MIFYFLISVVFISEIIIALTVIFYLKSLDTTILKYNSLLTELRPMIKDILNTYKDLSKELLKLAPIVVNKVKDKFKDFLYSQIKNCVGTLTFWFVKKEVEKRTS